ncbi:MAG: luxQ 1 [Candidatus Kaiserbacteria bacterium]|nr:luxQ 1 [Candidatus Kaiserbacteria bacterium]
MHPNMEFENKAETAILESLDIGVALFSADRKLLYLNAAMAKVTGGDPSNLGSTLEKLADKHRLRTAEGDDVAPAEFPIEKAFAGEETRNVPYIYIGADGRHLWLSVSCVRILDESGALKYVFTTIADIYRRKTREDKLHFMIETAKILSITSDFRKRLHEKARLAVPALADWCAIDIVREGDIIERVVTVHRNPEKLAYAEGLLNRFPPDRNATSGVYNIIRTGKSEFFPTLPKELIDANLSKLPAKQQAESREVLEYLQLNSLMTVPIVARGRVLGVMTLAYAESGRVYTEDDLHFFQEFCNHLGLLLDNAHLYEEISRKDRAKDLFLASLSHELRNPLAPIKNSIELLKLKDVPEDIREEMETIEHQFDHMAKLLNDLLDVTRFTQDKIEIAPHAVEMRRLVERALKSTDALLRTADITLHYTYSSSPVQVWADDTRIEQAITNLMSNAAKYTPSGGSIWVDIEREGDSAVIKIRDNGEGIDPLDLPRIFEMYYQGRDRNHASGLGIGLLLVQRIVNLHGGTIEAHSEGRGRGSEFIIRLPTTNILDLGTSQEPKNTHLIAGKHVVIVDDNKPAADSLAKLLNKLGGHAQALYSGEAAVKDDFSSTDLILLDIGMPGLDGYETIAQLRENGISVPIVALTGYGLLEDKQKALDAGFTAHLTKPVGLKELTTIFATVFNA